MGQVLQVIIEGHPAWERFKQGPSASSGSSPKTESLHLFVTSERQTQEERKRQERKRQERAARVKAKTGTQYLALMFCRVNRAIVSLTKASSFARLPPGRERARERERETERDEGKTKQKIRGCGPHHNNDTSSL